MMPVSSSLSRAPAWRVALVVVLGIALAGAAHAAAERAAVELRCESFGNGPQLECVARLRSADGAPLQGAKVTLGATMPSMPMAHSVAPAAAAPTGQPGEYRGLLRLEMPGVWAVQVDVAGPLRDRAVRSLRVDACAAQQRCVAGPSVATAQGGRAARDVPSGAAHGTAHGAAHGAPHGASHGPKH